MHGYIEKKPWSHCTSIIIIIICHYFSFTWHILPQFILFLLRSIEPKIVSHSNIFYEFIFVIILNSNIIVIVKLRENLKKYIFRRYFLVLCRFFLICRLTSHTIVFTKTKIIALFCFSRQTAKVKLYPFQDRLFQ